MGIEYVLLGSGPMQDTQGVCAYCLHRMFYRLGVCNGNHYFVTQ